MPLEKFEVRNRWSGDVQFTAEIECEPETPLSWRLRLAVLWALKNGANLSDANLSGAKNLSEEVLRPFKADFWMTLAENRAEVPALIAALESGRVDGWQYHGDCACLVGTIANARGINAKTLSHNSSRPAERWFMMIRKGDKPDDKSGGGFAAAKALEWAGDFLATQSPRGE